MTQWYRIGTCSVASGSKTVTFSTGVTLNLSVKPGDALLIGTGTNQPVEIGSITDNTHCELVENWPYASATSAVYAVIPGPNWDDRTALSLDVATYLAAVSGVTQSSTTLTIGMGSQTLQIPHSTRLSPGAFVTISDTAAPTTRYMAGIVTSYIGSQLTVAVTATAGSGSGSSWNVNASGIMGVQGPQGADGPQGPAGTGDVTAATSFGTTNSVIVADGAGKGVKATGATIDSGGRLKMTGSGYVTNPTGPIFGQYDATTGYFQMPAGGMLQIWDAATAVVATFLANGKVGIGTASPAEKLSVSGHIGSPVDQYIYSHSGGAAGQVRAGMYLHGGSQYLAAYTDSNERIRIDAAGNVGIGTTTPSAKLHVYGNLISTDNATIGYAPGSGGIYVTKTAQYGKPAVQSVTSTFGVDSLLLNPAGGNVGIGTNAPTYQLHVSSDSAAKPGTNTWTISSDVRLKENIVAANLQRCWDIVKGVPLKRYTWKDDAYTADQVADRSKLGWIAQDVQPFFKNAVTPHVFSRPAIEDGVEEYQEQDTVERTVEREHVEIVIRDGVPVQVSKTIRETVNEPVVDHVVVVDESGQPVMREVPGTITETVDDDGNVTKHQAESTFEPVTHPVPRMVTKTRPKMRTDTIDDCLSLNADQIYAAMYGALQLAMQRIEALEAQVTALKSA